MSDNQDLVLSAVENALYELAQEQQFEGNDTYCDYDITRGPNEVYISFDDGTAITLVATEEAR